MLITIERRASCSMLARSCKHSISEPCWACVVDQTTSSSHHSTAELSRLGQSVTPGNEVYRCRQNSGPP